MIDRMKREVHRFWMSANLWAKKGEKFKFQKRMFKLQKLFKLKSIGHINFVVLMIFKPAVQWYDTLLKKCKKLKDCTKKFKIISPLGMPQR